MFGLSLAQRFLLFHPGGEAQPVDMHKNFDGLSGMVQQDMGQDACSGDD